MALDPQAVWDSLTDVERTCLGVAYMRWKSSQEYHWQSGPAAGEPWYTDPYGALWVTSCIPAEEQKFMEQRMLQERFSVIMPVRTAELDQQIRAALTDSGQQQQQLQQMVVIGAGTDTRAWRLSWPPGFVVYEVDTEPVIAFKNRVMDAAEKQQREEGHASAGAQQRARRVGVAADASDAAELWSRLLSSGFNATKPTLYLLEGFIGYLDVSSGNALLHHLYSHTAAGSRIIMTAPPSAAEKAKWSGAAAAGDDSSSSEGGEGGVPRSRLHHTTFEEPTDTLARLSVAGWHQCELLTVEQLKAKYGTEHAQAVLLGRK